MHYQTHDSKNRRPPTVLECRIRDTSVPELEETVGDTANQSSAHAEFLAQVRDALNHLHDYPYLETHTLAQRFWPDAPRDGAHRAQRLYRLLLESIEALNPAAGVPAAGPQMERYLLLVYRYIEGREVADITRELGYSRRQFFREQRKALLRLAALLWQKLPQPAPAPAPGDDLLVAEAERVLVQREAVHLADVVQGVLSAVGALAEQRRVTLEAELAERLPPVYGNRTLLRQVLLKILSELITRPGASRVSLHARVSEGGIRVTIQARPPAGVPASTGVTPQQERALGSAQRLVEMMGGRWQGHEQSLWGSVCRFDLPPDTEKTLLVVEDNEGVVRAFRRYLTGHGYQVAGADSGPEALRLAGELNPAAIVLDVMMPVQDGWEVLQALKNDPATRDIPVFICSVLDDPDLAYSLGAAAYLHKPVTQANLLAALAGLEAKGTKESGSQGSS